LALLGRAMTEFGDLSGLVFNRRTGHLVSGHQRMKHLPADLPIVVTEKYRKPNAQGTVAVGHVDWAGERWQYREVDVSETVEKAMNIAANQAGGSFEFSKLTTLLAEITADGFDVKLTGFDDAELKKFSDSPSEGNGATLGDMEYQLVVSCSGEHQQAELCQELESRGLKCRMLTL
jgi:hypothetical protein